MVVVAGESEVVKEDVPASGESLPAIASLKVEELGLDKPAAFEIAVPSPITRALLRYQTPVPLSELLQRAASFECSSSLDLSPWTQLAVADLASRRGLSHQADPPQLARFRAVLEERRRFGSPAALAELANEVDHRNVGFRDEMSFAGGPTSAQASLIYAPSSSLSALIDDLAVCLKADLSNIDGCVVTSTAMFYCIHAHPFRDGNGRWARVVALSAGASSSASSALCATLFQLSAVDQIIKDLWPDARRHGLRRYLKAAADFSVEFSSAIQSMGTDERLDAVGRVLVSRSRNVKHARALFQRLLVREPFPLSDLRKELGLSQRATLGLADELETAGRDGIAHRNGAVSGHQAIVKIEKICRAALIN